MTRKALPYPLFCSRCFNAAPCTFSGPLCHPDSSGFLGFVPEDAPEDALMGREYPFAAVCSSSGPDNGRRNSSCNAGKEVK